MSPLVTPNIFADQLAQINSHPIATFVVSIPLGLPSQPGYSLAPVVDPSLVPVGGPPG